MYINDVLRIAQDLYPSEYDDVEMYMWCNDVSSQLLIEDRNIFKSVVLPVASDGSVLLPDGVSMEYIEYVTAGNIVLNKRDMRSYGGKKIYIKGLNGIEQFDRGHIPDQITVDYLVPYTPIRMPKYHGSAEFDLDDDKIYISKCEFIAGDLLVIQTDYESDNGTDINGVPLLFVDYDNDKDMYALTLPLDALSDLTEATDDDTLITRVITDKTVCDAPFDSMYIDYVLAKICDYQRDTSAANRHMTSYNSRLAAYKSWLQGRMPSDDCSFRNWW